MEFRTALVNKMPDTCGCQRAGHDLACLSCVPLCDAAWLYYDALNSRQRAVGDLARSIRQELTGENQPRDMHQNALFGARPSESSRHKYVPSSSSGTEFHAELTVATKAPAPPAPEARSRPGHTPTDTERSLEIACQFLETVHGAVAVIKESWSVVNTYSSHCRSGYSSSER